MKYIKKQPFVMSGLTLGLAALGNLLQSYGMTFRLICGAIALVLFLTLTIKIILNFSDYLAEFKNPATASVYPTYPMTMMLLSTYLEPLFGLDKSVGHMVWWAGIVINAIMMVAFIFMFVFKRNINLVFPSWGVVSCGIVVASVTAPYYGELQIGQLLFWLGLVGGIIVLPFMLYRVYKLRNLPEPAIPTITILCAPFSLLVAGYVNSFPEYNRVFLIGLLIFAQILYFTTVVQVPGFMRLKFIPSFSGLTFPLVISALSLKLAVAKLGIQSPILNGLILVETLIATFAVIFVLVGYLRLIYISAKEDTAQPAKVA